MERTIVSKISMWLLGGVAVIVVVAAAAPFLRAALKPALSEEIRQEKVKSGAFVQLEDGVIHYADEGARDAPVILMLHGFSTSHFVFDQNAAALLEAGFRVIRFDHFGRGWSDRPRAAYDADFYDKEILQLLEALSVSEPIGLIGYSMGGVLAADFAARRPERVARAFLLTPAGLALSGDVESLSFRLLNVPLVGDWLWHMIGRSTLLSDPTYDEEGVPEARRLQGDVTEQMRYAGYFEALLATFRNLPMRGRDEIFAEASEKGVPMMALFGDADVTVPIESAARLRVVAPAIRVEEMKDAPHSLPFRRYDEVNALLLEFFAPLLGEGARGLEPRTR